MCFTNKKLVAQKLRNTPMVTQVVSWQSQDSNPGLTPKPMRELPVSQTVGCSV